VICGFFKFLPSSGICAAYSAARQSCHNVVLINKNQWLSPIVLRAKVGWSGNIFPLDAPGTVEVRIEYEKLGLVPGEAGDIGVAFDVTDTRTKWKFWPSSASTSNPSTWGTWHIE
jgi:hypothetical protein